MPLVTLTTNIPDDQLPRDLNLDISKFLSKLFNKPVEQFSVVVDGGKRFTIGGTIDPAVLLVIKSIGTYNETDNINFAKEVSEFVQKNVGVGNDRCVIHFQDISTTEIAHFGTTVKEHRKKQKS